MANATVLAASDADRLDRDRRCDDESLLRALFDDALARGGPEFMEQHSEPNSIKRQIQAFRRYRPYLPRSGAFLDWGCHHAPDACLLRRALGDGVTLFGCDFGHESRWEPFHDYASLRYSELTDRVSLPYDDEAFDAVVGAGVLEHTAMDTSRSRSSGAC